MPFLQPASWFRSRTPAEPDHRRSTIEQIVPGGERSGPPAIALARARYGHVSDVVIDLLETESRLYPDGIEVRAWVRLPEQDIPAGLRSALRSSTQKLAALSSDTRQIFFLSASYGLSTGEIARVLGLRRGRVRHAILEAIAALDTQDRSAEG